MPPTFLEAARQLPLAIYEEVRKLSNKYDYLIVRDDCGKENYVITDFLDSARLIIATDRYKMLAQPGQSVHENIMELLRNDPPHEADDPVHAAVLPIGRYLRSAAIIAKTDSYKGVLIELYNPKKHCVRCHETYPEGSGYCCMIPHAMNDHYAWGVRGVEREYYCQCCGSQFSIEGNGAGRYSHDMLYSELCVIEEHTDNVSEVENSRQGYNDINIERCMFENGQCLFGHSDEDDSDEEK